MKYIGWILFFILLAGSILFYTYKYLPLMKRYKSQQREIKMWTRMVEELKQDTSELVKDTSFVTPKDSLIVILESDMLFPSLKSDEISNRGKKELTKLADKLRGTNRTILIIGHTDSIPIGPNLEKLYPSHWELSTRRASAVVRFLISQRITPSRLIAAGCGASKPISSNDTKEGRKKNRRIEVYLR